ncbi:nucleosome-remodeling factor subunit BPTF-like [Haliotis cracherodii]|uniref:nucleosome-remodeling factor subunit BPTF-like n=1 Tax=Haliotis cracherodii TaxID=6455 RepID=UPI0039E72FDC
MATRSRRMRGRPPKTPLSSNRTNFLRKPKAFTTSSDPNSRSSTPVSGPYFGIPNSRGNGRSDRGRGRDSAVKSRSFISSFLGDDDELSSTVDIVDADRSSDITDLDTIDLENNDTDDTYDGSDSDFSEESISTISSSVSKRRLFSRRPKSPDIPDDKEIPPLTLPPSSTDLILSSEYLCQTVGIYEVLRHFRTILRLSPFTFEDYCAALLSDEQCTLIGEIHICLLKALMREEESNSTVFGPHDLKDSINVSLFFIDGMTWSELARAYLDSDRHDEYRSALPPLESCDFPFVPICDKLKVLQTLTDLFLATNKVREEITNEGNIQYDDHCRNCHKLGDLLCCETCSAVYHLACVDPPLIEVPDDDWLCNVCRAHQVKGVTDCISEAEKSGLLCRQEPIGFDRHGRKYWFLVRRLIVEGENEVWYYSTKAQIDELLEAMDGRDWERDLVSTLHEMRDDISKQMTITDELTNTARGNKKSTLEVETTQLTKLQSERALKKAQEEVEKKAKEEEEKRKEEEKKYEAANKIENDEQLPGDKDGINPIMEKTEVTTAAATTTTTTSTSATTVSGVSPDGATTTTQQVTETTETTTIKSTTFTVSSTGLKPADTEDKEEKMDTSEPVNQIINSSSTPAEDKSGTEQPMSDTAGGASESKSETESEKSTNNPSIVSLQSVFPNAKTSLLKSLDEKTADGSPQTKTVLVVNREGGKVTLSVATQPLPDGAKDQSLVLGQKTTTTTSTTSTVSALETRKILTRSKTGSLTPKQFTDSVTSTTSSFKSSGKTSADDVLVINRDGEITRVTRSKSSIMASSATVSQYFRLGNEGNYKLYQNQYSTNTLALNKHQHNEERDKRRHLSHKFSMTPASEFKWNGTVFGNRMLTVSTLRLSITQLENNIHTPFLHPNWPIHRQNWQKAVHMCQNPQDFGLALAILEACIKPVICNPVWTEALGHSRLQRITTADREEMKKREKEVKKRKEEEEEGKPLVWIKYPLGLKHQVWKQRGEEYRITGGNGWLWDSSVRNYSYVPQDTVGLRAVAVKLRARKKKALKASKMALASEKMLPDDKEEPELSKSKSSVEGDDKVKEEDPEKDTDVAMKESKSEEEGGEKMEVDDSEKEDSKDIAESKSVEESKADQTSEKMETDEVVKVENKEIKDETVDDDGKKDLKNKKKDEDEKLEEEFQELQKQLPPKVDVDLIDVGKAMLERTYYIKVTKPYAKLDGLLDRRQKQDEWERKNRQALEQQISWKQKWQSSKDGKSTDFKIKVEDCKKSPEVNGLDLKPSVKGYKGMCYSLLCRTKGSEWCYSPVCRKERQSSPDLDVSKLKGEPGEDSVKIEDAGPPDIDISMEDEEIDVEGDKDNKSNGSSVDLINSLKSAVKDDSSNDGSSKSIPVPKEVEDDKKTIIISGGNAGSSGSVSISSDSKVEGSGSTTAKSLINSDPAKVAQLFANRAGVNLSQAHSALQQAISKMSIDDLKAKLPPVRKSTEKFKLAKFTKIGKRGAAKSLKKASLPVCQKFQTACKKKSIFILERHDLRKMARKGSNKEASGFNYNCKMNNVNWIYPCPRPVFRTAWRFRTQTIKSLAAAAMQLRILWSCIRWDDVAVKPPAGGTNTVSTETEITTTELLKRRDVGPYGLRSEFLVRKIVVPIGVPTQPKEKYTPQRSGLRERKRPESPKQTEPSVTETWVPEEDLDLWEIKQFGEKLEKQRAASQEKTIIVTTTTSSTATTTTQNAAQIKAQMEQQLKQQRFALQQKRLQEAQGKTGIITVSTATTTTASSIINSTSTSSTPIKTITLTTNTGGLSTISTPTIIKQVQMQPKTIIASSALNTASPVRPGVKVQLPGTTITLRPTSTVALAPKPGVTMATTATTTAQAARLIAPGQVQTPKAAVRLPGAVQIRPQVVAQGLPGQVQNVQIIQGPSGQLQVRGLLPGQQIIRLPDGRLQLITLPTAATAQPITAVSASSATSTATPTVTQVQARPTVAIRPQTIVVSAASVPGTSAVSVVPATRVMVPAQLSGASVAAGAISSTGVVSAAAALSGVASHVTTLAMPTRTLGGSILASTSPAKPTIITSVAKVAGTPVVSAQAVMPNTTTQIIKPLMTSTLPTMTPVAVASASAPTVVTTAAPVIAPSIAIQSTNPPTIITSPVTAKTVPRPLTSQITVRTQLPAQTATVAVTPRPLTIVTSPTSAAAAVAAAATVSPAASAAQKYAITPQVVQQVVRQALMQNQTPEIQAKLLAMQRQIQQQQQGGTTAVKVTTQPAVGVSTLQSQDRQLQSQFQQQLVTKQQQIQQAQATESARAKQRTLTQEQKDDQMRLSVCNQVLKTLLDKIEREEKQEQKRQRKQESVEEKQKRVMATKLQGALFKHKEALKKEILRKRTLMEKNLQQDILMEVADKLKKQTKSPTKPPATLRTLPPGTSVAGGKKKLETLMPQTPSESAAAKKRKQKIISTGGGRAFNPKEKLYCICKTPYDDAKFYIGCDLCSNWFHGACVGITENQASSIDSYICEDCRKQQENTSEELYCVCRTPYDEAQFYIGCDRCQDWFHGHCVNVSRLEADRMDTYICPNCINKEQATPIAQKCLTDKEYENLRRLLRSLQSHKMAWPFLEPVDPKDVPDYYLVVKDPMDLSTVEKRLNARLYQKLSDFVKDVTKIFDNCRFYNPSDSPFYQCAEVLETFFVQRLKSMRERF